jgi:hypothetical protein
LVELVVEGKLLREDAGLRHAPAEAEREQLAHRVRLQVDAVAERRERGHRLVDTTGDADLVQAQRARQAGNAAADNDHVHGKAPRS